MLKCTMNKLCLQPLPPSSAASVGARNECVHVSVSHTICKASVTHFSECAVSARRKVFKVILSGLSVSTVSVPPLML